MLIGPNHRLIPVLNYEATASQDTMVGSRGPAKKGAESLQSHKTWPEYGAVLCKHSEESHLDQSGNISKRSKF